MKYSLYLLCAILALIFNISSFAKAEEKQKPTINNQSIRIEKIFEKTVSPDGKFAIARVTKGRIEDNASNYENELYFINTQTNSLITRIIPAVSGYISNLDITATWNNNISNIAVLMHYGKIMIDGGIFSLRPNGQFQRVALKLPNAKKINKTLEHDSEIYFKQDVYALGSWIDNNTISLITGRYYHSRDDEVTYYLISFNAYITPKAKAEIQNVKVIGKLNICEYNTFEISHYYQFGDREFY